MKNETAQNILTFLDRVQLNGHKERIVMNQCVDALGEFLDIELQPGKSDNGTSNESGKDSEGK